MFPLTTVKFNDKHLAMKVSRQQQFKMCNYNVVYAIRVLLLLYVKENYLCIVSVAFSNHYIMHNAYFGILDVVLDVRRKNQIEK